MSSLDGTKLGMMAAMTLGAACGSGALGVGGGVGSGSTSTGSSTHTGMGGAKTTTTTTTAVSTGAGGGGGAGGAGGGPSCNPPAAAGSLWALGAQEYGVPAPTSMCNYRGDVLLIVNTADV